MARNPFSFLDDGGKDRTLLLLLLALIKKNGGELTLDLTDLTSIENGASFHKYTDDTGARLVLRYARKGAEAFFLTEQEPSTTTSNLPRRVQNQPTQNVSPSRHAIHDDVDLALREEQMAERARRAQQERLSQARAESGSLPWRTRPQ